MVRSLLIAAVVATLALAASASVVKAPKRQSEAAAEPYSRLDEPVEVHIPGIGSVIGFMNHTNNSVVNVHHFIGIPYGVKPERFAPSTGFERWLDEPARPAKDRPNMCMQAKFYPWDVDRPEEPNADESEDCLTLDIFTPQLGSEGKRPLPVFFFLHGGAFVVGSSKSAQPDYLLEQGEMVLVSAQYRLGVFGFLAVPDGNGTLSNAGLHDQMLALKWTVENIATFGGDPTDIVVGGVSAGGATSGLLTVSPVSRPNITGALLFSGCAVSPFTIDPTPERTTRLYAEIVNCSYAYDNDNDDSYSTVSYNSGSYESTTSEYERTTTSSSKTLLECLRSVSAAELASATFSYAVDEKKAGRIGMGGTIPIVDGNLLPNTPEELMKDPSYEGLPMVIGITKHEGQYIWVQMDLFYIKANGYLNNFTLLKHEIGDIMLRFIDINDTMHVLGDAIQRLYYKEEQLGDWEEMWAGTVDFSGAGFFKAPAWNMAKLNSERGGESFLYTFNYIGQHTRMMDERPIAAHGSDQIYLFPARNESFVYHNPDWEMVRRFTKIVADFVVTKEPTSEGSRSWLPEWKPATRHESNYLLIDDNQFESRTDFTQEYYVVNAAPRVPLRGPGAALLALLPALAAFARLR